MKIIKSSPTNAGVLETYGGLLKIASLLIVFSQLISSLTETGVSYAFFYPKFEFLGWGGIVPSLLLTGVTVYLLESGGKTLLSIFIDSILYRRWKTHLSIILLVVVGLATIALYYTSYNFSMNGKDSIVETFEDKPELAGTTHLDSILLNEKQSIRKQFSNDSLLIANNWNSQILTMNSQYQADISELQTKIDNYKRKEQRTGNSYISSINYVKGKIEAVKSEQASEVGKLELSKGNELKQLISDRKADTKTAINTFENEKQIVVSSNDKKSGDYDNKISKSSNNLGGLVIVCIPLLILSVLIQRIIYKEAGVIVSYHFDDYHFRDSILNTWKSYASEKVNEKAYRTINGWHSKVKDVQLTDRPIIIFDRSENTRYIKTAKEDLQEVELIALGSNVQYDDSKYQLSTEYQGAKQLQNDSLQNASTYEKKALELMAASREEKQQGNDQKAKELEIKAKQVIKAFFESDFTPKYSKKLAKKFRQNLGNYLEGIGNNPFDDFLPKTRRKIGFNIGGAENESSHVYTGPTAETSTQNNYSFFGDKHTVPHQLKNGEIKRVNMGEILSKIKTYSERVNDSYKQLEKFQKVGNEKEVKRHSKAVSNREQNLSYWNNKKVELTNQAKVK